MPLQQSTDETVAHLFYNVDHPDCLTTLLAVLLVQGTSLCGHPVSRHGDMATNQSEQRAHTLSKKSADHGKSQFVYPNPQPFVSKPRVGQNRVLQNSRGSLSRRYPSSDVKRSRSLCHFNIILTTEEPSLLPQTSLRNVKRLSAASLIVASRDRCRSRHVSTFNILRAVQNAERSRQRTNNAGKNCAEEPVRRMPLRATRSTGE